MAGSRSALLISAGSFEDAQLQQLRSPKTDSRALVDVLADPAIGDYNVQLLEDQTNQDTLRAVEKFFREAQRDDLYVLYFAGHGLKDHRGRLYFAASDTQPDFLSSTAMSAGFISEAMEACRARQIVVILDCCYSGAFPAGWATRATPAVGVLEQLSGVGRVVITSSNSLEYALEGDADPESRARSAAVTVLPRGRGRRAIIGPDRAIRSAAALGTGGRRRGRLV